MMKVQYWEEMANHSDPESCVAHREVWIAIANDRALRFHDLAGFKREPASAKTVPIGTARVEEIRLKRALS